MALHLVKLSVGSTVVDDLANWVKRRVAHNEKLGRGRVHDHVTRMFPRRADELLDGGSLYWVIKGVVLVRQAIVGLETVTGADGIDRCAILMNPEMILTEPQPRRAFQGWRYLPGDDAPGDLSNAAKGAAPAELQRELAILGLL